jgi:hypothetical protein
LSLAAALDKAFQAFFCRVMAGEWKPGIQDSSIVIVTTVSPMQMLSMAQG